jgi:hypothetical protein
MINEIMYLKCTVRGRNPIYSIIDNNKIIADVFIRNRDIEKINISKNYLSFQEIEEIYKLISNYKKTLNK